ncbi:hypothetical protein [Streptomyces sp. NPDC048737]|uniref:hypothetical protein n=1 Tax=unclassified Streptomyces TaxID=2593676 RepID=UPI00341D3A03
MRRSRPRPAAALTVLPQTPAARHAAIAHPPGTQARDRAHHYADRRPTTTTVVDDCDATVSVTGDRADGQWAPRRTCAPHGTATSAGHGFGENRVIGPSTRPPETVRPHPRRPTGPRRAPGPARRPRTHR